MSSPPLARVVTEAEVQRARHEAKPRSDRTAFPQALRSYRQLTGLSQSKLAERAGFDHSYVSRLECGQRTPTREAVGLLADALGLDAEGREALMASAGYVEHQMKIADPSVQHLAWFLAREDVPEVVQNRLRRVITECISLYDDVLTEREGAA